MKLKFDKEQLKTDIMLLEEKGIDKDTAEYIAQFKQVVDLAAFFQENLGFVVEEEDSAEICQSLDNANYMLEQAWWEISPIFEREEVAVAAVG